MSQPRFTVHLTFKNKDVTVINVDPADSQGMISMQTFADRLTKVLGEEDGVLSFKKPTYDGSPGFLLVPVRSLASVYVS